MSACENDHLRKHALEGDLTFKISIVFICGVGKVRVYYDLRDRVQVSPTSRHVDATEYIRILLKFKRSICEHNDIANVSVYNLGQHRQPFRRFQIVHRYSRRIHYYLRLVARRKIPRVILHLANFAAFVRYKVA